MGAIAATDCGAVARSASSFLFSCEKRPPTAVNAESYSETSSKAVGDAWA